MNYNECKILCKLKRSETPLISKVPCDEFTEMAQLNFDYEFDGISKIYPYELPKEIKNIDYQIMVICGASGSGKAQPINTIIPTPNGNKKLGDIQVGDYVYDRKGKPTKVLGVYPQGVIDNYEVTLSDGRKTYCNDEHLWTCYTSKGNFINKTLRQMINSGIKKPYSCQANRYKIPINDAIEYSEKEYTIDPYVIGSFLGNGCCKQKQLTMSSNDIEQINEVANLLNAIPCKNSDKNYNWTFKYKDKSIQKNYNTRSDNNKFLTLKIFEKYVNNLCCYSHEKSIPDEYKYGSIKQRFDLLQGLFDTDGCITKSKTGNGNTKYSISYSTTSINLCNDICDIIRSLGYICSVYCNKRNNKKSCYQINVVINNSEKYKFFRLSRKLNIALECKDIPNKIKYNGVAITDIKQVGKSEMVCIYVDNDEHLYLTNDYIVTHNTTLLKEFPQYYNHYYKEYDNSKAIISNFGTPDEATHKLSAVGLNSIPCWCRPRNVLSIGEGFRADIALNLESDTIFDEFTSTIDRNVAKGCCNGIQKYIRKNNLTNMVFCSCHKDYIPYLKPDIVIDLDDECVYDCRGVELGETLPSQFMNTMETSKNCGGNFLLGTICLMN